MVSSGRSSEWSIVLATFSSVMVSTVQRLGMASSPWSKSVWGSGHGPAAVDGQHLPGDGRLSSLHR